MVIDSLDCNAVRQLVGDLRSELGPKALGFALGLPDGRSVSVLNSWEKGQSYPDEDELARLKCADDFMRIATVNNSTQVARACFIGSEDEEPSSCPAWNIRADNFEVATALARQYAND